MSKPLDPLLSAISSLVSFEGTIGFPITVFVNGQIICGEVATFETFIKINKDLISANKLNSQAIVKVVYSLLEKFEIKNEDFIYLKNISIWNQSNLKKANMPNSCIKIRKEDISAIMLGRMENVYKAFPSEEVNVSV